MAPFLKDLSQSEKLYEIKPLLTICNTQDLTTLKPENYQKTNSTEAATVTIVNNDVIDEVVENSNLSPDPNQDDHRYIIS